MRIAILFLAYLMLPLLGFSQTTWYVNVNNTRPPWDGSQQHPFNKIQDGVFNAVNGDTVLVLPGTYYENINFLGKSIIVKSQGDYSDTIIDRQGLANKSVVSMVLGEDENSVLKGFTITNGKGTDSGSFGSACGGGVLIKQSSPLITHCLIRDNSCIGVGPGNTGVGGGVFCFESEAVFTNCIIAGNYADMKGGGLACGNGDFPSALTITNCTFADNDAGTGGGMYISGSSVIATNCIFWDNTTTSNLEIAMRGRGSYLAIDYCDIEGGAGAIHQAGTVLIGLQNINANPRFVNQAQGDYRLRSISPCIEEGNNNALELPADDIEYDPRIMSGDGLTPYPTDPNAKVDIGADEYCLL